MSDFDWVSATAACSTQKLFADLEVGIRADVDAANAASKKHQWDTVFHVTTAIHYVQVTREDTRGALGRVIFQNVNNMIAIEISPGQPFPPRQIAAYPRLNAKGECKPWVDNQELEEWQLRQLALGGLFFSPSF